MISNRLSEADYRPCGFDYMRIILATGVILQHTVAISYGQTAALKIMNSQYSPIYGLILPMFFSLSGFLVAGSLERNRSLISFLGFRALRLMPALAFEIVLSAVVLGAAFTTLPLKVYVNEHEFSAYFLNIIGRIHYVLPAVFMKNPCPGIINGQLWTIPAELKCYMALALLGLFGLIGRKPLIILVLLSTQIALIIFELRHISAHSDVVAIPILVGCFLFGVCAFRLREILSVSRAGAVLAGLVSFVLLLLPHSSWLLPFPVTYFTVYLGTLNLKRNRFLLGGDYSYGLYLYGFPIQQAVAALPFPHIWWVNFALSYPLAFGLAMFSWWFIEKPAMKLKSVIYYLEKHALRLAIVRWHSQIVFDMSVPAANV